MKLEDVLALAAGVALGIGACWLKDKFIVLEYRVDKLEDPDRSRVTAEGTEADPEAEDVKGTIGFWRGNGPA